MAVVLWPTSFVDRRAFICGDAAHLWMPNAGYGMNAGIADAARLVLDDCGYAERLGAAPILDAYEAERQPITDQVSHFAMDVALEIMKQRARVPAEIELPGLVGDEYVHALASRLTISTGTSNALGVSILGISTIARRSLRL